MLSVDKVRADFPIFKGWEGDKPLIYLDNAASSQKPQSVIDAITKMYTTSYANVHRSPHRIGEMATDQFEGARQALANFIGAEYNEVIFTRGATEALNLAAKIMSEQLLKPGDVILTTMSEHHSNLIPWQMAAARTGAQIEFVKLHGEGFFDLDEIRSTWNRRTKVFAFQHASNVLGTIHPVSDLCQIAREQGAITVVDGAQSAPHIRLNMKALGCDFYAISGHKMCGPSGTGALWGRAELLDRFEPVFGGGEMISKVSLDSAEWNEIPYKFEAGTPNIEGAVGLGAAVKYLQELGMDTIEGYVSNLAEYAYSLLSDIPEVKVFGPAKDRTGAVSFWMDDVHPHDVASILDYEGIAVRAGHHCAEPLTNWLGYPATVRASFYIYNTREEVQQLIDVVAQAREVMGYVT